MKKALLSLVVATIGFAPSLMAQLTENFETTSGASLPTGWMETHSSTTSSTGNGWVTNAGTVNWAIATLPAHTRYVFVDDNNHYHNQPAHLTTTTFAVPTTNPYLSYDYFYLKARITSSGVAEQAWIEISTDGGSSFNLLDSIPASSTTAWGTRYMSLSSYAGSTNCQFKFCYTDNGGGATMGIIGVALDNITVFTAANNDAKVTAVYPLTGAPDDYFMTGTNATFRGVLQNHGLTTITAVDINYQVNGGAVVTSPLTGLTVAPWATYNFTAPTPYAVSATGVHNVKVWATLPGDADNTNDSGATTITGVSFMPEKKVVFEEGTGTWCGWCPRGIVFMDSLKVLHGNDASLIAVHNGDPMTVSSYDSWLGSQIGGYPSGVVDRLIETDPGNFLAAYTQFNAYFGYAEISLTKSISGSTLSVPVTVRPATDLSNAKLAIVITEDGVKGTSTGYAQRNYYSYLSNNQPLTGGGKNYQDSAATIPATSMVYDHVARAILPSATGATGLLPTSMTAGSTYNYTFNVTLNSAWDTNKLHAVVMLIDGTNGFIMNSQNIHINTGGVSVKETVATIENISVFPNPANSEAFIKFDLNKAATITVEVYDMAGRTVLSIPASEVAAGTDQISIPLNNFVSGIYTVKIANGESITTAKLNVAK